MPILKKVVGSKKVKTVYRAEGTTQTSVPVAQQEQLCLSDEEIITLAKAVCAIEDLYSEQKGSWCPMDVEWAKDGFDNTIYIVQARPETIHAQKQASYNQYQLASQTNPKVLVTGQSIGQQIISGTARIIASAHG